MQLHLGMDSPFAQKSRILSTSGVRPVPILVLWAMTTNTGTHGWNAEEVIGEHREAVLASNAILANM